MSHRVVWLSLLVAGLGTGSTCLAQANGIFGYWRSPGGSVLHVVQCGGDVCAVVVAVSKSAPASVDRNNPDASLQSRSLCNLQIGYGFKLGDANHAADGRLYDPENGKTYRGSITAEGEKLELRGYIGFKAFGRSETWTRTDASQATCR